MKFNVKIGKIEEQKTEAKVFFVFEEKLGDFANWPNLGKFEGKIAETRMIFDNKKNNQKIILLGLGKKESLDNYKLQKAAASLQKKLKEERIRKVALERSKTGLNPDLGFTEALVSGMLLGGYEFRKYKTETEEKQENKEKEENQEITILVKNAIEAVKLKEEITRAEIFCQATNFARDLVNEPPSLTTPSHLAKVAESLGRSKNIKVTIFGEKEMKEIGMGAILGVSKGSDEEAKFIKLEYHGGTKKIVLGGKGVTFDTGGLSLKPQEGMETMKMDMAGAAAILGIFSVIDKLKPKVHLIGLIPATENMPSGKALKPGDILKTYSGKTIEVLNTDAEGRLILADILSYGLGLKPDIMIDLATLTGACMVALGEEIAGLFTRNEKLSADLMESGKKMGEKLWPMPLEDEYKELLKSDIADLKNISGKKYGGAITAALFLEEFVGSFKSWAHLDIAGPAFAEKESGFTPKGGTGFGVRTILNYLEKFD